MKTLTYTTITTHLSKDLDHWLNDTAKREQVTKRELFEKALRSFRDEQTRQKMIRDFKKASGDKAYMKEMHEMAEEGMGDYFEQLKRYEQ